MQRWFGHLYLYLSEVARQRQLIFLFALLVIPVACAQGKASSADMGQNDGRPPNTIDAQAADQTIIDGSTNDLIPASDSLTPPIAVPLSGTFLVAHDLPTDQHVRDYFTEVAGLDMKTLIIYATRLKTGPCTNTTFHWLAHFPDRLELILSEADQRQMEVYVGLALTSPDCASFFLTPNKEATVNDTTTTVEYLQKTFGQHQSLRGWYIPDEPALAVLHVPPGLGVHHFRVRVPLVKM